MTQTLQSWSTATYFANAATNFGVANQIKSIVANADGGYTIFADQGRTSFANHSVAVTFDALGNQTAPQTNADFLTGFVEWGGHIDEVVRSGGNLVYSFETYAIIGLIPGFPTMTSATSTFTASALTGHVLFGHEDIGFVSVTQSDFSIDTAPLTNGLVAKVVTGDQNDLSFQFHPPVLTPQATAIVVDAFGAIASVILADPGGAAIRDAAVTGFSDGSFIGLWSQDGVDGSNFGLQAQRVSAAGALLGANFAINENTAGGQVQAHAATMADGSAFVVWSDGSGTLGDADGLSIKGRIIHSDGTFATSEFLINQTTAGHQFHAHVVALNVNQVLVLWIDAGIGLNYQAIRGIVFDNTGHAISNELVIASGASVAAAHDITAALLSDGRVVVGWANQADALSYSTIIDPRPDVIFGTTADEAILGRDDGHPLINDIIVAGAGHDTIYGFGGDDQLYGEGGIDLIFGGAGNDQINGGDGNDTLYGDHYSTQTGNDTILGGSGDDVIFGQNGDDQLHGEDGNDILVAGSGNDTLFGGAGNDGLHGEDGNDTALGGDGADALWGYAGNDILYGEAGTDVLLGGSGDDTMFGGTEQDALYGDDGFDQLFGGTGDDFLFGGGNDDALYGEAGIDVLLGGDGADTLFGGADGDALYGEAGNDVIYGGTGYDFIFTGTGADVVVIESDTTYDQIYDFANGEDRILFQGTTATNFSQLVIANGGGYTAVTYGAGAVLLWGITVDQLDTSDFLFA